MSEALALPLVWDISYRRNPFFTGRGDVPTRLHDSLHADSTAALTQPQGISETQAALEYAYCYHSEYRAIL